MNRHIIRSVLTIFTAMLALLLVACGAPATEQPTGTPTPATAATPTTVASSPTTEPIETAQPTATTGVAAPTATASEPSESETPAATSTATTNPGDPGEPGMSIDVSPTNVFGYILGPTAAPEGWRVEACQGNGPLLCVFEGTEHVGTLELNMSHWETLPDFQAILKNQSLEPGAISYRDEEQAAKLLAALRVYVEEYHKTFEEDREIRYRGEATYKRMDMQETRIADIPGVRYGFTVEDKAGKVLERWISYAAFDGNFFYILVPNYDEGSFFSFRTDEHLQKFDPHMPKLLEGLKLPLPVLETDVKQVRTLFKLPLFRHYGVGSNPIVEVPFGETLDVTGQSADKGAWRVTCPDDLSAGGECWISAHPKLTQPAGEGE